MNAQVIPMWSRDTRTLADTRAAVAGQFIASAAHLIASTLATAAPGGAVTPAVAYQVGRNLALTGRFTGLVEVDADGGYAIEPMDAWLHSGTWHGTTRPLDGDDNSRSVVAPDDAVVNVRWPDAPVSRRTSLSDIIEQLEGALLADCKTPSQWLLPLSLDHLNVGVKGREQLNTDLSDLEGVRTVPTGVQAQQATHIGPSPEDGALKLRAQLRTDVEAAFGLIGLLSETDGVAIHGHWRVATVRTFEPLARLVEAELTRKVPGASRFNRAAWVAAPHSEVARATAQRAVAVQRLVAAGMDLDRAVRLAGMEG